MKGKIYYKLKVKIDGYSYFFSRFFTIFQACLEKGLFIPRFCYHSKLKISGNCRICLVEEKGSVKPLASCAVLVSSGMNLFSKTSLVKKSREGVIEYLLINHPLDCPICDQGGECDLQDQVIVFGNDFGRFYEYKKRSVLDKNFGVLIKTSLNRCIQCSRCTRFLENVSFEKNIRLLGRGVFTEIGGFDLKENFIRSELSANIIDICPVGALTSKISSFRGRFWKLSFSNSFDILDVMLTKVRIEYNGTNVFRILPRLNTGVSSGWISDKIRFIFDSFKLQRLTNLSYQVKDKLFYINYLDFYYIMKLFFIGNIKKLNSSLLKVGLNSTFQGSLLDILDILQIKGIVYSLGLFNNHSFLKLQNDFRGSYLNNNFLGQTLTSVRGSIENSPLFLISINPRFESPILNTLMAGRGVNGGKGFTATSYLVGYISTFTFLVKHLGTSLFFIRNFIFNLNNNFVYVMGDLAIGGFSNFLVYIRLFFTLFQKDINFWSNSVSSLNLKELNTPLPLAYSNKKTFLMGYFNLNYLFSLSQTPLNLLFSKFSFSVYQGSHVNYLSTNSNVLVPHSIFVDRSLLLINTFGLVRKSNFSFFKINNTLIKEDWLVTKTLRSFLSASSFYNYLSHSDIVYGDLLFSQTLKFRFLGGVQTASTYLSKFSNFFIFNSLINSYLNNFYLNRSNCFLESSKTLSLLSFQNFVKNDFIYVSKLVN